MTRRALFTKLAGVLSVLPFVGNLEAQVPRFYRPGRYRKPYYAYYHGRKYLIGDPAVPDRLWRAPIRQERCYDVRTDPMRRGPWWP